MLEGGKIKNKFFTRSCKNNYLRKKDFHEKSEKNVNAINLTTWEKERSAMRRDARKSQILFVKQSVMAIWVN